MSVTVASLLILILSFLRYYVRKRDNCKYPPGPKGWPIVGNLHQITDKPEKQFMQMASKYGDIFSLKFGSYRIVVLNNYKVIRELLGNPVFCGRPNFGVSTKLLGLFYNQGKSCQEQRRLVLKTLRDHGFGRATTENRLKFEISTLLANLSSTAGTGIDPKELFALPVINTLWPTATGSRLSPEDHVFRVIFKDLSKAVEEPRSTRVRYFPLLYTIWMKCSIIFRSANNKKRQVNLAKQLFTNIISQHMESINWDGESRDLVDEYLKVIRSTTDKDSHFFQERGMANLVRTLKELLLAGGDTTSRALHWTILLLAKYCRVQTIMQQEIERVLGRKTASLEHKDLMPYTQSVILEVLRFSSFLPFAVLHSTTEDTKAYGYDIPKNTIVFPNLYGANHDPKEWSEPDEFQPERFLSADGTKVEKTEAFLAFSTGKRICPGMSYALDSLFLFATGIFQNFVVQPMQQELSTDYYGSIMTSPKHFEVKFVRRNL